MEVPHWRLRVRQRRQRQHDLLLIDAIRDVVIDMLLREEEEDQYRNAIMEMLLLLEDWQPTSSSDQEVGDCSICFEPIKECESLPLVCHHTFHAHCLNPWRHSPVPTAQQCPNCRAPLRRLK